MKPLLGLAFATLLVGPALASTLAVDLARESGPMVAIWSFWGAAVEAAATSFSPDDFFLLLGRG
jgi:hypothetical protein